MGLILAFVGAFQLVMFGARIYVAGLMGVDMVCVMGTMMAGRTDAAFTAQLGAMHVNEEIDALKSLEISSIEFLASLSGCMRGMQCNRSIFAVGDAAISAVATGSNDGNWRGGDAGRRSKTG